jgi:hypothetical protein
VQQLLQRINHAGVCLFTGVSYCKLKQCAFCHIYIAQLHVRVKINAFISTKRKQLKIVLVSSV